MSAKMKTKKNSQRKKVATVILLLLLAAVLLYFLLNRPGTAQDLPDDEISRPISEDQTEYDVILKRKLKVEKIGSYSGIYMEDGTDETVTGILMMIVTNISEEDIQYAEIELPAGTETAKFTVSTLPAGATVVLLEQNRMPYSDTVDYQMSTADCTLLAVHNQELSQQEEKLQIQLLDGAINITNISGEDIQETIVIYYKNVSEGIYYGGITYRIRLEDGLKSGELKQIMADHFNYPGSEILFVELIG